MAKSIDVIQAIYRLTCDTVKHPNHKSANIDALITTHKINPTSAENYIVILKKMIAGKTYKRALSAPETDVFITNIVVDFGVNAFNSALNALELHIAYRDSLKQHLPSLEAVLKKHRPPSAAFSQVVGVIQIETMKDLNAISTQIENCGEYSTLDLVDARQRVLRSIAIRQGAPTFRRQMIANYGRCAVTGTKTVEVLEAAHIIPYAGDSTNNTNNGLLLRCDIHTLFDLLLITINNDYCVVVHDNLRGTRYGKYSGNKLYLPKNTEHWPSQISLQHHRQRYGIQ